MVVAAPIIPLVPWMISTGLALRAQLPFPTPAIALLGGLGVLLIIPVALITFGRFLVRGVTPSLRFVVLAAILAAVIPFAASTVPPFSLPEPTPVPGTPTLFVSAAPYGNDDLWVIEGGGDVREGDFARLILQRRRLVRPVDPSDLGCSRGRGRTEAHP
jgi:hypothetical protein